MDALTEAQSIIWDGDGQGTGGHLKFWGGDGRCAGVLVTQVLTWGGDGWDAGGRDAQFTIWGIGGRHADPGEQNAQFTMWCRGDWDSGRCESVAEASLCAVADRTGRECDLRMSELIATMGNLKFVAFFDSM